MNYFEYFSEIEQRFTQRRGSILLLSTLDWALIESWREAEVPLAAVLRGIDDAFDKYDARSHRARGRSAKVNGLAWCAQAVMQAAEQTVDAATGMAPVKASVPRETGFERERVAKYLEGLASATSTASHATSLRLLELAATMRGETPLPLDDLDRTLTVLEEKLLAALQTATTEDTMVALRAQADRELAPYRSKMSVTQLRQVQQRFMHKRLLESAGVPRLSLFYMGHGE